VYIVGMPLAIETIYAAAIRATLDAYDAGDFDRAHWLDWQLTRLAYLRGAT
jgi:hypothetical protein